MAYAVIIEDAERVATLTLAATVNPGDLLGYNSGWVKADANAIYFAEWIAMAHGESGQRIKACKKCVCLDEDAPYTADKVVYLSETAGAFTETRPATDGDLIQVVGRTIDTERTYLDIGDVKELDIFLTPDTYDGTGEPGLGTADSGWVGPQIDAAAEAVYFKGRLPSNIVGSIQEAKVLLNSINGSAADLDFSIVGAYDGASNVQDTGTAITTTDWEQADTDNIVYSVDVSALFDAGFFTPERNFCLMVDPDGITADVQVIGLHLRVLVAT
ncbi:MAG: hypothetical protein JRE40_00895 [Deltaproteobacteria bacterium]|nr:hypothetical protein [Deltaproteobacteria bacterium]